MMTGNAWMRVVAVGAAAVMMTGCATKNLQQQMLALEQENIELRDELDSTRSAFDATAQQLQQSKSRISDLESSAAAPSLAATNTGFDSISGVEASIGTGHLTVRVPGDILFDSGKTSLKSSARHTLSQIASVIRLEYGNNTVRVAGFSDRDPIRKSKWADNLELSGQRAMAVHRYLRQQGIDSEQMYAAAFGSAQHRGTKAKSRRVEIMVELN